MNAEMRAKYETAALFNHTVKIVRTGSVLKLDYELVDTDGNKYDLWKIRDQNKPTFSIYQDNIKIGDGAFEFGYPICLCHCRTNLPKTVQHGSIYHNNRSRSL